MFEKFLHQLFNHTKFAASNFLFEKLGTQTDISKCITTHTHWSKSEPTSHPKESTWLLHLYTWFHYQTSFFKIQKNLKLMVSISWWLLFAINPRHQVVSSMNPNSFFNPNILFDEKKKISSWVNYWYPRVCPVTIIMQWKHTKSNFRDQSKEKEKGIKKKIK